MMFYYAVVLLLFGGYSVAHPFPIANQTDPVGKLAFKLAQDDQHVSNTEKTPGLLGMLQEISQQSYVKDFLSLMKIISSKTMEQNAEHSTTPVVEQVPLADDTPRPRIKGAASRISLPIETTDLKHKFDTSFSMDAPVTTQNKETDLQTVANPISKEEWASTLFGEKGVLTGVFRMMDQQRKAQKNKEVLSDTSPQIQGKNLDLKKVFDSLLMGSSNRGELGDPGPELPEFLGICNRLSCGDIYKAIDKFRTSEFFSNFQTALGLIQDPNGWETIGKLLSNPDLIAQFAAGSGMENLLGSALGEVKKESGKSKTKNSKLLPEDGNFGIDFSEMAREKNEKLPEVDFSIDGTPGSTGDYYEEVSKSTDILPDKDYIDVEVPSETTSAPTTTSTATTTTGQVLVEEIPDELPELSFSIDEDVEDIVEGQTFEKAIRINKRPSQGNLHKSSGSFSNLRLVARPHSSTLFPTRPTFTTTRRFTSRTTPTTMRWTTAPSTTTTTSTVSTTTVRRTTTARTTTKNFRRNNDYYAMYYDDQ